MRVLIVRHAIAVSRGTPGFEVDADRPLTPKGIRRMRRNALGLRRLVTGLEIIHSSPLARAAETAALVAAAWAGQVKVETSPALAPGAGPAAVLRLLRSGPAGRTVGLVGHEPGCSALVAFLLTGHQVAEFEFRKGGAALLEVSEDGGRMRGRLLWHLSPRILRFAAR